jgi:hypothetical protein
VLCEKAAGDRGRVGAGARGGHRAARTAERSLQAVLGGEAEQLPRWGAHLHEILVLHVLLDVLGVQRPAVQQRAGGRSSAPASSVLAQRPGCRVGRSHVPGTRGYEIRAQGNAARLLGPSRVLELEVIGDQECEGGGGLLGHPAERALRCG